jgi:hypothetical protein
LYCDEANAALSALPQQETQSGLEAAFAQANEQELRQVDVTTLGTWETSFYTGYEMDSACADGSAITSAVECDEAKGTRTYVPGVVIAWEEPSCPAACDDFVFVCVKAVDKCVINGGQCTQDSRITSEDDCEAAAAAYGYVGDKWQGNGDDGNGGDYFPNQAFPPGCLIHDGKAYFNGQTGSYTPGSQAHVELCYWDWGGYPQGCLIGLDGKVYFQARTTGTKDVSKFVCKDTEAPPNRGGPFYRVSDHLYGSSIQTNAGVSGAVANVYGYNKE